MSCCLRRVWFTVLLGLVLVANSQESSCKKLSNKLKVPSAAELSTLLLLDQSLPAIRYLRAFTVPCLQQPPPPSLELPNGSWASTLSTLWNDLTAPNNGIGRLVTSYLLYGEATELLLEERFIDSASAAELSVLLRLFPYRSLGGLPPWQRGLVYAGGQDPRTRIQLARLLVLLSKAKLGQFGRRTVLVHEELRLVEEAALAAEAGLALFDREGIVEELGPTDPSAIRDLPLKMAQLAARLLNTMSEEDACQLAAARGVAPRALGAGARVGGGTGEGTGTSAACAFHEGERLALLQGLLPSVRFDLILEEAEGMEDGVRVRVDPSRSSRYSVRRYPGPAQLYRRVVADALALLPPSLLHEAGLKCHAHSVDLGACAREIGAQLDALVGEAAPISFEVDMLFDQTMAIEDLLDQLDAGLEGAATGVRSPDGSMWLGQPGWLWQLSPLLQQWLYSPDVDEDVEDEDFPPMPPEQAKQGAWEEGEGGVQQPGLCLDRAHLLRAILDLNGDELMMLEDVVEQLVLAQLKAGGAPMFWDLVASQLLTPEAYGMIVQQALTRIDSGEEEAAWSPRRGALRSDDRSSSAVAAAILCACALGAASLYVYGGQLPGPWRSGAGRAASSWSSAAQRAAATASLRAALHSGDAKRLLAAVEAARGAGVEKPLVKKAKAAAQLLRKRGKVQGAGGSGRAGPCPNTTSSSTSVSPPAPASQQVAPVGQHQAVGSQRPPLSRSLSEEAYPGGGTLRQHLLQGGAAAAVQLAQGRPLPDERVAPPPPLLADPDGGRRGGQEPASCLGGDVPSAGGPGVEKQEGEEGEWVEVGGALRAITGRRQQDSSSAPPALLPSRSCLRIASTESDLPASPGTPMESSKSKAFPSASSEEVPSPCISAQPSRDVPSPPRAPRPPPSSLTPQPHSALQGPPQPAAPLGKDLPSPLKPGKRSEAREEEGEGKGRGHGAAGPSPSATAASPPAPTSRGQDGTERGGEAVPRVIVVPRPARPSRAASPQLPPGPQTALPALGPLTATPTPFAGATWATSPFTVQGGEGGQGKGKKGKKKKSSSGGGVSKQALKSVSSNGSSGSGGSGGSGNSKSCRLNRRGSESSTAASSPRCSTAPSPTRPPSSTSASTVAPTPKAPPKFFSLPPGYPPPLDVQLEEETSWDGDTASVEGPQSSPGAAERASLRTALQASLIMSPMSSPSPASLSPAASLFRDLNAVLPISEALLSPSGSMAVHAPAQRAAPRGLSFSEVSAPASLTAHRSPGLLASLQQIWGEDGGGDIPGTGTGAPLGGTQGVQLVVGQAGGGGASSQQMGTSGVVVRGQHGTEKAPPPSSFQRLDLARVPELAAGTQCGGALHAVPSVGVASGSSQEPADTHPCRDAASPDHATGAQRQLDVELGSEGSPCWLDLDLDQLGFLELGS